MMCLPDDTLLALTRGAVDQDALDAAHGHLDSCPRCRRLLVALSGAASTGEVEESSPPDDVPAADLPIGRHSRIGRYVVTGVVGAGGMGAIYAAHDPELDRRVAVKLLHPRCDQAEGPAHAERLRREARAMARLVHPNVVQVYDAGEHGARTFIAMELVEGRTLRAWLAESPRSTAEIVAAFVQAGRGLSAAHDAGLLHRDFKPDNVFVARDGSIKVGDFGLARPLGEPSAFAPAPVHGAPDTVSAHACGTPAYLAPEVMAGAPASVASDVFSFCVSLWEGLHGQRPFAGPTAFALLQEARAGRIQPRRSRAVPARLRRIVARGLAGDPASRPRSMAALLQELEPRRPSLMPAVIAAGVALVAAIVFGVASPAFARCSAAAPELAPAWSEARRRALARAFRAAGQEAAWARIDRALSGFGAEWISVHSESCRATRIEGRQSEEVRQRRLRCLMRQRQVVTALGDLWLSADEEVLARAPAALASLPLPSACGAESALNAPAMAAPPAAIAPAVAQVRRNLAEVAARLAAGDPDSALPAARSEASVARRLAYPPLEAEALLDLGRVLEGQGEFEEGERTLREAAIAAASAGHEQVLAESLVQLARMVGISRHRLDDGELLVARAAAVVARLGDRKLSCDLQMVRADLQRARSHAGGARSSSTGLLPMFAALDGPACAALQSRGAEGPFAAAALGKLAVALEGGRPRPHPQRE